MEHIGRLMGHRPADLGIIKGIAAHITRRIEVLLGAPWGNTASATGTSTGEMSGVMRAGGGPGRLPVPRLDEHQRGGDEGAVGEEELAAIQLVPAVRHIFPMGHALRHRTSYQGLSWAHDDFVIDI